MLVLDGAKGIRRDRMADEPTALAMTIDAGGADDDEEVARLAQRLRSELLELDVDDVVVGRQGDAPDGAKGGGLLEFATLVVHFAALPDVLGAVVGCARAWLSRQSAQSLKLTLDGDSLEITGHRSDEQDRLIALWVTRHAGTSTG
jgi:hypothetical protein